MNQSKLNELFKAAAKANLPPVPEDFSHRVIRQVRQAAAPSARPLLEQLNQLFPRLALGAAAVIALALAIDFAVNASPSADLSEQVAEISAQWLLP